VRGDLAIRRSIARVVFEVRSEIAEVCQQMAVKCGELLLKRRSMMTDAVASAARASVDTIARSVATPTPSQWRPRCTRFPARGQFGLHQPCSHGSIAV